MVDWTYTVHSSFLANQCRPSSCMRNSKMHQGPNSTLRTYREPTSRYESSEKTIWSGGMRPRTVLEQVNLLTLLSLLWHRLLPRSLSSSDITITRPGSIFWTTLPASFLWLAQIRASMFPFRISTRSATLMLNSSATVREPIGPCLRKSLTC